MRWKLSLIVLTFIIVACTAVGTPLPPPEAAPVAEAELEAQQDSCASCR